MDANRGLRFSVSGLQRRVFLLFPPGGRRSLAMLSGGLAIEVAGVKKPAGAGFSGLVLSNQAVVSASPSSPPFCW